MNQSKKTINREQFGYFEINKRKYNIYEGLNILGRDPKAGVPLKNTIDSKQHAILIAINATTFYLSDFDSSNGTQLRGAELEPLKLYKINHGDEICFTSTSGIFYMLCKPSTQDPDTVPQSQQCDYEALTQILPPTTTPNIHECPTQVSISPKTIAPVPLLSVSLISNNDDIIPATQELPASQFKHPGQSIHTVATQIIGTPNISELPTQRIEPLELSLTQQMEQIHTSPRVGYRESLISTQDLDAFNSPMEDDIFGNERFRLTLCKDVEIDDSLIITQKTDGPKSTSTQNEENVNTAQINKTQTSVDQQNEEITDTPIRFKPKNRSNQILDTQLTASDSEATDAEDNIIARVKELNRTTGDDSDATDVDEEIISTVSSDYKIHTVAKNRNIILDSDSEPEEENPPNSNLETHHSSDDEDLLNQKPSEFLQNNATVKTEPASDNIHDLDTQIVRVSSSNPEEDDDATQDFVFLAPASRIITELNTEVDHFAPTQILNPQTTKDKDALPETQLVDDSESIFLMATQKVEVDRNDPVFLEPTQKLDRPIPTGGQKQEDEALSDVSILSEIKQDDDTTPVLVFCNSNTSNIASSSPPASPEDDVFLASTQKVVNKDIPPEDDIFLVPTQKVGVNKNISPPPEDDPYLVSTTNINPDISRPSPEDDIYLASTQKVVNPNMSPPPEVDPYLVATTNINPDISRPSSEDDIYLASTQKVINPNMSPPPEVDPYLVATTNINPDISRPPFDDDIYLASTQKVANEIQPPRAGSSIKKEPIPSSSKKFSKTRNIKDKTPIILEDDTQPTQDFIITKPPLKKYFNKKLVVSEEPSSSELTETFSNLEQALLNSVPKPNEPETQLEVAFLLPTQKEYIEEATSRPNNPLGNMFAEVDTQTQDVAGGIIETEAVIVNRPRVNCKFNFKQKKWEQIKTSAENDKNEKIPETPERGKRNIPTPEGSNKRLKKPTWKIAENEAQTSVSELQNVDTPKMERPKRSTRGRPSKRITDTSEEPRPTRRISISSRNKTETDVNHQTNREESTKNRLTRSAKRKPTATSPIPIIDDDSPTNVEKHVNNTISDSSDDSTRKTDLSIGLSSPTKRRKYEPLQFTPQYPFDLEKPKVVFTMLNDPNLEKAVKSLGGLTIDSVGLCTVLVTGNISRSLKFLTAVGLGKPIVNVNWIWDSLKKKQFLNPWDYLLIDKVSEKKYHFSLHEALNRAKGAKLFTNYTILLALTKNHDVLKEIITTCGGKVAGRLPSKKSNNNVLIVGYEEENTKYAKYLNKSTPIIGAEAIFSGVLKQKLDIDKYLLE